MTASITKQTIEDVTDYKVQTGVGEPSLSDITYPTLTEALDAISEYMEPA